MCRCVRAGGDELRRKEAEKEENVDEESDVEPNLERGTRVQPARAGDVDRPRSVAGRGQHRAGRVERRSTRHQRSPRPRDAWRAGCRCRTVSLERAVGRSKRTRSMAYAARRHIRP